MSDVQIERLGDEADFQQSDFLQFFCRDWQYRLNACPTRIGSKTQNDTGNSDVFNADAMRSQYQQSRFESWFPSFTPHSTIN
jgi:hypothetical protein